MQKITNAKSDLQGILQLVTDSTIGVVDLVEAVHKKVVNPPFLPETPIQQMITKVASTTYKSIKWSTRGIGILLDKQLELVSPDLGKIKSTAKRSAVLSVLNGIVGDYLEKTDNPLRITMQFKYQSRRIKLDSKDVSIAQSAVKGKVLLMIHGLCKNDIQWTRNGHNHGATLAKELGRSVVYLHYNSGRHISHNGKELNDLLEKFIRAWPVTISELTIVGHSMGGLVARSAIHYGLHQKMNWPNYLKKVVFLGTPHHGATLERAGNYLDNILDSIPYTKPFARLGKMRSAGVTDLRYGNLIDEDIPDNDRFELNGDLRQAVPLPKQIDFYSIAAVVGKESASISSTMVGDTLVSVRSALGQHKDPSKDLEFVQENTWIVYDTSHSDLLSNPKICSKIKEWID